MTYYELATALAEEAINTLTEILKTTIDADLTDLGKVKVIRQEVLTFVHTNAMAKLIEEEGK